MITAVISIQIGACAEPKSQARYTLLPFRQAFILSRTIQLRDQSTKPLALPMDVVPWGGHIAVVDEMDSHVVIYGNDGRLLSVLGRSGDGPGELRWPVKAQVDPDGELAVLDSHSSAISFFRRNGTFDRRTTPANARLYDIDFVDGAMVLGGYYGGVEQPLMVHVASLSGTVTASFAKAPTPRKPLQANFNQVWIGASGATVAAAQPLSQRLTFISLKDGKTWSRSLPLSAMPRPHWLRRTPTRPQQLIAWANKQTMLLALFSVSPRCIVAKIGYPGSRGDRLFRYVGVDPGNGDAIGTAGTTENIMSIERDTAYALDGDATSGYHIDVLAGRIACEDDLSQRTRQ